MPDLAQGNHPIEGRREIFNRAHSSLRSVIERTIGVWKKKWVILRGMRPYPFPKQCAIVVATMALHNYIRRYPSRVDPDFGICDRDEDFIHPEAYMHVSKNNSNETMSSVDPNTNTSTSEGIGAAKMSALRNVIADLLQNNS